MMPEKDKRYGDLQYRINGKFLTGIRDILTTIPIEVLAADLWMGNVKLNKLIHNVELFKVKHLYRIADLIGVDVEKIMHLTAKQYHMDK